jgi:adenylate cyclase class IV
VTSATLPCCDSFTEPSYPSPRRNLELKARERDQARSLEVCRELGAEDHGTLTQRDTYFEVPRGRLKLREEPDAVATLIAYERPDLAGNKESRYRLVEVPEPAELRVDRVEGLGDFIEFEGVAADGGDPAGFTAFLDSMRERFDIREEDLLRESYSDLVRSA